MAYRVRTFSFPNLRFVLLNDFLVSAHFYVNHGARCLSHLFGFVTSLRVANTSTTPAIVAYSSRNSSTRSALSSFVIFSSSIIALKAAAKSSVDEYALQVFALMPYDAKQSPVRQRYRRWFLGIWFVAGVAIFSRVVSLSAAEAVAFSNGVFGPSAIACCSRDVLFVACDVAFPIVQVAFYR
jgi:hypothetical protein